MMEKENKVTLVKSDDVEKLYVNGKPFQLLSSVDVLMALMDSGVIKQFEVKRL